MSLKYNVYKNQLFVYFRDIDGMSNYLNYVNKYINYYKFIIFVFNLCFFFLGFTKVKILIECSRSTENLLDAYKVSLTDVSFIHK